MCILKMNGHLEIMIMLICYMSLYFWIGFWMCNYQDILCDWDVKLFFNSRLKLWCSYQQTMYTGSNKIEIPINLEYN